MKEPIALLKLSLLVALSIAIPGIARPAAAGEEYALAEWSGVSRVTAVGDLHGSYEKAIRLFQGAGLIDDDLRWIGGEQHLVTAGDLLDRGPGDRELMDLMMRLQRESREAGGRVHVVLGNHESMNLLRDRRYVNPRSLAAWAEDETAKERKTALRQYANSRPGSDARSKINSDFQYEFPPGFFARQQSLDLDGVYGKWLLTLPTVVKINGVVYVHGGITVETAAAGIEGINGGVTDNLRRHLEARRVLESKGIVTPFMDYGEIRQVAKSGIKNASRLPPELLKAAQDIEETSTGLFLGSGGPLWYRGNSFEDERIEQEMLERSLELLGARAMVVAHSPTSSKKITSRFHGKLFKVDHNIGESDRLQALVVEAEDIVVIDASSELKMMPVRELPTGNHRPRDPAVLSDRDLRELLAEAEILGSRPLGRGSTRPELLELKKNGTSQRGIFKSVEVEEIVDGKTIVDRYQHEMAAYRLDRALGLNMVPVTVLRAIEGQTGSVQEWVEGAIDREAAEAYELDLFSSSEVADQLARGRIFDLLIGNAGRKPNDILCLIGKQRVYFIDHSRAFTTSTEIDWLEEGAMSVDPNLVEAIERLDRPSLIQELGELIDEKQIDALLVRRDKILEQLMGRDAA